MRIRILKQRQLRNCSIQEGSVELVKKKNNIELMREGHYIIIKKKKNGKNKRAVNIFLASESFKIWHTAYLAKRSS